MPDSYLDWQLQFRKKNTKKDPLSTTEEDTSYNEKNHHVIEGLGLTKDDFSNFMRHWREKNFIIQIVNIFDIDDCICPNLFPNLNEKADIEQVKTKILETPLYPEFIQYYKHIIRDNNVKAFFITGRRFKDFGYETKFQLKPLDLQDHQIVFFPDNFNHSKIRYFIFKIFNILKIAANLKNIADVSALTGPGIINVFDDLYQYYPKLLSIAGKLGFSNINVQIVKDPEQYWKLKLNEVKNND